MILRPYDYNFKLKFELRNDQIIFISIILQEFIGGNKLKINDLVEFFLIHYQLECVVGRIILQEYIYG